MTPLDVTSDGNNMSWKAVRLGVFGVKLIRTMCFKLKNNIYILDSWHARDGECNSCGKYDLREKEYHRNVFEVPFIYFPEVFNEPKIITDANETFAIFVVRIMCYCPFTFVKEKMWIFTEDEGFRSLCDLETASIFSQNVTMAISSDFNKLFTCFNCRFFLKIKTKSNFFPANNCGLNFWFSWIR